MKPANFSALDLAFPTSIKGYIPEWGDIPQEFRAWPPRNKWGRLVSDWFYSGVKLGKLTPKEGIDAQAAMRHVQYCMKSFEPKHEHKEAGCAYLLSLWFDDIEWTVKTPEVKP